MPSSLQSSQALAVPCQPLEPLRLDLLEAAAIGFATLDNQLRFTAVNSALSLMLSRPESELLNRSINEVFPNIAARAVFPLQEVLRTGRPIRRAELTGLPLGEPEVRDLAESILPITGPDGKPIGIALLVWDITHLRRPAREAIAARAAAEAQTKHTRMLQRLTAAIAGAADQTNAAEIVLSAMIEAVGAQAAVIAQLEPADHHGQHPDPLTDDPLTDDPPADDRPGTSGPAGPAHPGGRSGPRATGQARRPAGDSPDTDQHGHQHRQENSWQVLASTGLPASVLAAWNQLGHDDLRTLAGFFDRRGPVLLGAGTGTGFIHKAFAEAHGKYRSWAILPLHAKGTPIGLAAFGWRTSRDFTPNEIDLFEVVAGQTANALERARLLESERRARAAAQQAQRRLGLLAEASAQMAGRQSEHEQLAGVADLLVQEFADWCAVLLPDHHHQLRRRVIRTTMPVDEVAVRLLIDTPVSFPDSDDPRLVAWRTGRPAHGTITLDLDRRFDDPDLLATAAATQLGPALAVPIISRGRVLGIFHVGRARSSPGFGAEDEQCLADIGHRIGTAIENARLLASRTRVAGLLQETLLPDQLPNIDGVELAAGYVVAENAADVGGDFYDAFPLNDGSYALVIGDVTGRGADAAGLTGLTRTALRALAPEFPPPLVLGRLNALIAERIPDERFLTAAYLHFTPPTAHRPAQVSVCLAGHPSPFLVSANGQISELGRPGPPLGVFDNVTFTEDRHQLTHGDTLVLYTDGLLEARGPNGQFGDSRLAELLPELAGRTASDVVSSIQSAVIEYRTGGADDLAILAARLAPPSEPCERVLLDIHLVPDAFAASKGRRAARDASLALLAADAERDLLLAVSEVINLAVYHLRAEPAAGPRPDPINLRVRHRGAKLRVEVTIPCSATGSGAELAEWGSSNGLRLVGGLANDFGTAVSGHSALIWFDLPCREP